MSQTSLFERMARGRPEWLAQGVLKHALLASTDVRRLVFDAASTRRKPANLAPESEVEVDEEVSTSTGWRADLVVRKPGGTKPLLRIELKIAASLTPRQMKARNIDIVVAPKRWKPPKGWNTPRISWEELATALLATDPVAAVLLQQAETVQSWLVSSIAQQQATAELENLAKGEKQAGWRKIYGFLCALDEQLKQFDVKGNYAPSPQWSFSKKNRTYYGYCFTWGGYCGGGKAMPPWWWMGFAQDKDGTNAGFFLDRLNENQAEFKPERGQYRATAIAGEVHRLLSKGKPSGKPPTAHRGSKTTPGK